MTNTEGKKMNRIHTACLSIYCSLMLSSLVVSGHHVRLAAVGGGVGARVENGALAALQGAAKEGFSVNNVGIPVATVPAPAIPVTGPNEAMRRLIETVGLKGHDDTMDTKSLANFGLGGPAIPEKEVDISVGAESRGAELFPFKGRNYLVLSRMTKQEGWGFLIDDSGNVVAGVYGVFGNGTGMHPLSQEQTQLLASAEKGFWLQWLADGAKVQAPKS